MNRTNRRRNLGLALILGGAVAIALFVVGTLMASCQAPPSPSAEPTASGAPFSSESLPAASASPAVPGSSPAGSAGVSPDPIGSPPAAPSPGPGATLVLVTPGTPPGQPGSSIEIPPPIP